MKKVYIFPGQGSQKIGMGKDIADAFTEAQHVFEEVDDALNQKLSRLMFEGSESDLNLTVNTQPALMAVSMALVRVLEKQAGFNIAQAHCVAGHSLGEYTALAAASVFSIADTARLLRVRGQAMQDAVPVGMGAMAAIIGLDSEQVTIITNKAAGNQICSIANDNCEGQIVISGHVEAIERAIQLAEEAGARKCMKLAVSAPFHCQLMQPAAAIMAEALERVQMNAPSIPLLTNVTANYETQTEAIRKNLVAQVTGQVRWRESIAKLADTDVSEIIEIGSGKVLTGLCKRIVPDIKTYAINGPQDIEAMLAA